MNFILWQGQMAYIHPESIVFYSKEKPMHLIYNSIILTKKIYLRDVTEIDEKYLDGHK